MKSSKLFVALACVAAASAALAQNAPAAPAAPATLGVANMHIGASGAVDQASLREALSSLSVVAVVGESAILKAERPIAGLPREMTVKSGRPFLLSGVSVIPAVTASGVEFMSSVSTAPLAIARLGQSGAEAYAQDQVLKTVVEQDWNIKAGDTIRTSVQEWAQRAGWHLVWQLEDREDFKFLAGNRFAGDFKAAVYGLFNSLPLDVKVRAELRPDNTPPMVVITRDEGVR